MPTTTLSSEAIHEARVSFVHFVAVLKSDFVFSAFARSVCRELQAFYVGAARGNMPSLMLEAPPQHGKSLLCAELFPAWCLGVNPDLRVAVATYAFPLARKRNLEIQRIIESPLYKQIFPETRLRQGNNLVEAERNAEGFEIVGRNGSLRAVGVGGSLTGFSVDIGIIDDPYKDMAEARSQTQNASVIEWYNAVFKTRLSKISGIVMMLTRWAINDVAGWCVENEDWQEIKYEAINEGRALVPQLHPIEQLEKIKKSMPQEIWEALYQQRPYVRGGNVIREDWLRYYQALPERFEQIFITADTAQKTKEHNDYTVFSVWGAAENGLYWLDMWRDRVLAPGLRRAAQEIWQQWHAGIGETLCNGFYIEDKSSGTGLIQDLSAQSLIPVIPLQRDRDKYTRLMDVLNYIESGRLWLPANAVWTQTAVAEMSAFSGDMKHVHDDIVDTLIDGLHIAFGPGMLSILDVI